METGKEKREKFENLMEMQNILNIMDSLRPSHSIKSAMVAKDVTNKTLIKLPKCNRKPNI